MTKQEEKSFQDLKDLLTGIKSENQKFREDISKQVEDLKSKTEKKHVPVTLEGDILKATQESVSKSIREILTKYDSPLVQLVRTVVNDHTSELKTLISDSFTEVIRTEDFKRSIVSAFSHKVARTIISNNDGLFDKVANELKQDAIFKSKMVIAVSNVINECLSEKSLIA